MRRGGIAVGSIALAAPGVLCLILLLVMPILTIAHESLLPHVAGRIGSSGSDLTFANYGELISPAYALYFYDTFRLGLIAAVIGLAVGYPVAQMIATTPIGSKRKACITFFVTMMFLSVLARVYSIALSFGPVGILRPLSRWVGIDANSGATAELLVLFGLIHLITPIVVLTLVGPLQNINPRLLEAAQSLGSSRWQAHLSVTLPLSRGAALSAFLISFSLCISAFIIPMVLGKGRVLFVSNLIYSRFSEVTNFPGGSAIAITLLIVTLLLVSGVSLVVGRGRAEVRP